MKLVHFIAVPAVLAALAMTLTPRGPSVGRVLSDDETLARAGGGSDCEATGGGCGGRPACIGGLLACPAPGTVVCNDSNVSYACTNNTWCDIIPCAPAPGAACTPLQALTGACSAPWVFCAAGGPALGGCGFAWTNCTG